MTARRLMPMRVMHSVAVKFRAVFGRMFTAGGKSAMITLAVVQMMIYVSIKVIGSVKPGSRTDKHAACKPLRPIVAVRGAVVRRYFVVSVRTNRRLADTHRNLRLRAISVSQKDSSSSNQETKAF